jgi:hypothetical protein
LFELNWTDTAKETYASLKSDASKGKQYKAVKKAIKLLSRDPRHPTLQTYEFTSLKGPTGENVFEAYIQQNIPAAYRIFWHYGPDEIDEKGESISIITIIAIVPHEEKV